MARGKLSFVAPKFSTKQLRLSVVQALTFLGKPTLHIFIYLLTLIFFLATLIKKSIPTLKRKLLYLYKQRSRLQNLKTTVHFKSPPFPQIFFLKKKETKLKKKVLLSHPKRFKVVHITAAFIIAFSLIVVGCLMAWQEIIRDLPSLEELAARVPPSSTKIYDRNGELLYTMYKDENRRLVSIQNVPLIMRQATLAAEDAQFYSHPGISLKGISRATWIYLKTRQVTSGSTISQQLVKNIYLTPEKTALRKIREIILALQLERNFTKDQILEMYLNEVSYGGTAYGIEQASQVYFGKSITEITLSEAAFLAGLPKSPSRFSPFAGTGDMAFARQNEVLKLMQENGFISEDDLTKANRTPLVFIENKQTIKAPHFVEYVREKLEELYGDSVATAGLTVRTSLDLALQESVQKLVQEEVRSLARLRVSNGAAIVINPKQGEILAMVGSRDYYDGAVDGFVNVVTRPRQPGSSIKVVNYAYALSHGMTPATVLDDAPVTFKPKGGKPYTPQNYDGRYRGKISLRSAFAESRNIPAVRVLNQFGVESMIEQGRKMGITSWSDPRQYGLSLTLGGGEITLLELAQVYGVVANIGNFVAASPFLEVTNNRGLKLPTDGCTRTYSHFFSSDQSLCPKTPVLDPRVAYLLIDILKDNIARSPAFGSQSALVLKGHPEVAVKTGTSNNLRDNLTVGFNQDYVVATWVGNNDGSPMSRVASGVTGASPMWNKIMDSLLKDKPSIAWNTPSGLVQASVCAPCEGCNNKQEWFLQENVQTRPCIDKNLAGNNPEDKKNEKRNN